MEKLAVRLRHGTAEPIQTEVNGPLLTRIRGLQTTQAIQQILQSLPEEKRPYAQAMLNTMQASDAVVEVVADSPSPTEAGGEVVAVDRRQEEPFDKVLSQLARQHDGNVDALEAIEIGTARLEKGGARPVAPSPTPQGDSRKAVPPLGGSCPPHPFFAAAQQMPFVVLGGQVFRVHRDPQACKPYFLFADEKFALKEDQSLQEYDAAYFEDDSDLLETAIRQRALGEATAQLAPYSRRPAPSACDPFTFVVNQLIPRLRAFHRGQEASERRQARAGGQAAGPLPRPKTPWRPQPLPLGEALPPNSLILAPHVYPLGEQRWLWRRACPDPGVYLPHATYGIHSARALAQVEDAYARLLAQKLEQEAARRAPRYASALLQEQQSARQVEICQQLCERSRQEGSEIILYDDPYHAVAVSRGVCLLYRHIPAFALHDVAGNTYYRYDATRLSIALPSSSGSRIFSHRCVRAESGFRHPLVDRSQVVLMDRCEDDIRALQRARDLCGALIKHLNDARLTLEVGYYDAPPPGNGMRPIARAEVERLGLPVYPYRHAS